MRCVLLLLLAGTAAIPPHAAQAQSVQRCMGPDGRAVYTDRRCDDIGAVQRIPPAATAHGARQVRGGCPRQLSQLVGEIGAAIQSQDVNRLSAIYDWRGLSGNSATRVFDRLEAIAGRPLVDIAPVYGSTGTALPADAAQDGALPQAGDTLAATGNGPAAWMPSWRQVPIAGNTTPADATAPGPTPESPAAATPSRPYPVALRIEQTLPRSATPARTVFGLHRAYGCFWISLP